MNKMLWNQGWKVWKDQNAFELIFRIPEDALTVDLPYDALISEKQNPDSVNKGKTGYLDGGVYNFYKELYVDPRDWGKRFQLEFEGIFTKSFIYVNDSLAGQCTYPYQDFFVDITDYLRPGTDNRILVVANAMDLSSRYYTGAGIYRDVTLWISDPVTIAPQSLRCTTLQLDQPGAYVELEGLLVNEQIIPTDVTVTFTVSQYDHVLAASSWPLMLPGKSSQKFQRRMWLDQAAYWSESNPALCTCTMEITSGETVLDTASIETGIRTVSIDPHHGLRINGQPTKLRGACIHHDQGLLGAATYYEYEYRRILKLKEAGFNAVRSSHNPASKALLRACDQLGVYVMDELFDMWNKMKNYGDYTLFFEQDYQNVAEAMVRIDYNHPSVILYSTGNEIFDAGTEKGYETSRKLSTLLHGLDPSRYITNGINGLLTVGTHMDRIMKDIAEAETHKGDVNEYIQKKQFEMTKVIQHPIVTDILDRLDSTMDVIGYNYMTSRYLPDHQKHPQRIMVGTETFPAQIAENWEIIQNCPAVLGDFTWTGYGYLGEAGQYPEIINRSGDLTVTALRRPVSYYREIVFGLRTQPYITVLSPTDLEKDIPLGMWEFTNAASCWHYPGEEGKLTRVEVYSAGDKVGLFLNGTLIEEKENGSDIAYRTFFDVAYAPGELKAVSYRNGEVLGESVLITHGEPARIQAALEDYRFLSDSRGLLFVNLEVKDSDGRTVTDFSEELQLEISGDAELLAFGSANTVHRNGYRSASSPTDLGCALAVLKKKKETAPATITIRFNDIQQDVLI